MRDAKLVLNVRDAGVGKFQAFHDTLAKAPVQVVMPDVTRRPFVR